MRIIGGTYSGRKILCPKGEIRPAMDRMRESVFAILTEMTPDARVLDLFSGSGSIGLEAASRGAKQVTMVEGDRKKLTILRRNTDFIESGIRIVLSPVERFIRRNRDEFDIVFADPPFHYTNKTALVDSIAASVTLRPAGLLIIHLPKQEDLLFNEDIVGCLDTRRYGGSKVLFLRKLLQGTSRPLN